MPTIKINMHSIYYEEQGKGAPLVLIPGLGSSCVSWWKQIGPLSGKYRVIALDNRGIGGSSRVYLPFSITDMADDVAALIQKMGIFPSHVIGVSMGGFIALTLALRHAALINRLVLAATSAGGTHHVPSSKKTLDIILSRNTAGVEAYCRKVYPALAGPGYMQAHPDDLDRMVANALEKPLAPETYLYQLNAIAKFTSAKNKNPALDTLAAPTLVVHGDADPLAPYPNGQYIADHIKGAKLITYKGCGHLLPIEAAEQFNKDVMDFLGE